MRLARYVGGGEVAIVDEPSPVLPAGGLVVQTSACGLCSGELMAWYMDRKVPHVLGHEVCGIVTASDDPRFPAGARVFPHHHAPCMRCAFCAERRYVHCDQWRRTKLRPGGMAESFAVSAENLTDTHVVDDLAPVDAALIEPLACVAKSLARLRHAYDPDRIRVIGLGSMGLLHMLALPGAWGCDVSPARLRWAERQGLKVARPEELTPGAAVFVCPGSQSAFETGLKLLEPGGELVMFSPLGPDEQLTVPQGAYFADATIHSSYSCGPDDSRLAIRWLREGRVRAQQVVSDFIALDELPRAYLAMRAGEILKAMVVF